MRKTKAWFTRAVHNDICSLVWECALFAASPRPDAEPDSTVQHNEPRRRTGDERATPGWGGVWPGVARASTLSFSVARCVAKCCQAPRPVWARTRGACTPTKTSPCRCGSRAYTRFCLSGTFLCIFSVSHLFFNAVLFSCPSFSFISNCQTKESQNTLQPLRTWESARTPYRYHQLVMCAVDTGRACEAVANVCMARIPVC